MAFLLLNILPFAWIFLSMGLGKKFYGDMTGSVGKSADEANIDRSLSFDDVAGWCPLCDAVPLFVQCGV